MIVQDCEAKYKPEFCRGDPTGWAASAYSLLPSFNGHRIQYIVCGAIKGDTFAVEVQLQPEGIRAGDLVVVQREGLSIGPGASQSQDELPGGAV